MGELVPYVFHHEHPCYHVIHWSGSTSCLKRHLKTCPHVGSGVDNSLKYLEREINLERLKDYLEEEIISSVENSPKKQLKLNQGNLKPRKLSTKAILPS